MSINDDKEKEQEYRKREPEQKTGGADCCNDSLLLQHPLESEE